MLRTLVANMRITLNVAGSSRMSVASVASTATILSVLDPDQEDEAWKFLRAELMVDGILPSQLATYKTEIIRYLKALIEGVQATQASPVSSNAIEPVGPHRYLDSGPSSVSVSSTAADIFGWKTDGFGLFRYRPAIVRHGFTENGKKYALLFCVEVSPNAPIEYCTLLDYICYFTLEAGNKSQRLDSTGYYPQNGQLKSNGLLPGRVSFQHGLTWTLWPSNCLRQSFSPFRLAALFDMGMHKPNEPVEARITLKQAVSFRNIGQQWTVEFAITNEIFQQSSPTILKAQDLVNAASGTYHTSF